ncbi:MAG: DUF3149 domain-containing protein [Gammaproteobacteria bacterium]|nr:DUF3149 domain-containing protein [Gammaproteobacteria bacterium]NIR97550.1 DUF3149 domain-containing protein [Gammaproteobacteria bacterium]NIT63188.1 DUF3149 domain-containing protein [Gammaproteobacteria bacterium]NIV20136.1 DUF3149 domain-containing protein [Gammaproteobacteria bacterium]NIX10472.1 DUF3149 domain-containing protein [Gammaproteobacteria bacterium]
MEIVRNLFGTWPGLLSLFVIVFMIGMAIFLVRMFMKLSKR